MPGILIYGRIAKIALAAMGAAAVLLGLLLYTPPGLELAGGLVRPLSGGDVSVHGLGGVFPNALTARAVEVADTGGTWLRLDGVRLRWSALASLGNHIDVQEASATRVRVLRRPLPSPSSGGAPTRIDVAHISLPRIEIAASIVGFPATLTGQGSLHYLTRHQFGADITLSRLGSDDAYRVIGGVDHDVAHGTVQVREGGHGVLAQLIGLPGLAPVNLTARADGDAGANRLALALSAGALQAKAQGLLQLAAGRADMDFTASAPAMAPRPDIAWHALTAEGHFHGRFAAPQIDAHLVLTDGKFAGVGAAQVTLDASGHNGSADAKAQALRVTLPGEHPGLFAGTPVALTAHVNLAAPGRPLEFSLQHKLATLKGRAQTRGPLLVSASLAVPDLKPFASLQSIDLSGGAGLAINLVQNGDQTRLALDGRMETGGSAMAARLLGRAASLKLDAMVQGSDIIQSSIALRGAAVTAGMEGTLRKGVLGYRLSLDLSDVSRLTKSLQGTLALRGNANGPLATVSLSASGAAVLATHGFARQRIAIDLAAEGLPSPENARLGMVGSLDGAPLTLHANLRAARRLDLVARWRSLSAGAGIALPQDKPITGKVEIAIKRLADIGVFLGGTIAGAADASVNFAAHGARTDALVRADLHGVQFNDLRADTLTAHGAIAGLFDKPVFALAAEAKGVAAAGLAGDAQARLDGPPDRLAVKLDGDLKDGSGSASALAAAAQFDVPARHVHLTALTGHWRGLAVALSAPASVDFSNGLAVDRLALQVAGGHVAASGRVLPQLALDASATDLNAAQLVTLLPRLPLEGTLSAAAHLTGTIAQPHGTVTAQARGLRAAFSAKAIAPAALDLRAQLEGDHATLTAAVTAGKNVNLDLSGTAPLVPGPPLALHVAGTVDLALASPLLAVSGRRMLGTIAMDADLGGSPDAPRVTGSAKLSGGEFQDYARGVRIRAITASAEAQGTVIHITQFSGTAGTGSLTGSGSIDLAAPGLAADFALKADNARPMVSDLIAATLSGDVRLKGQLRGALTVSGALQVLRGDINLPENFPPEIAILNVRRRGRPLPPPAPPSGIALDVSLRSTGPIFVRGHGLDAEMGGAITVRGTADTPLISGDFRMNRGSYAVAGQTLDFTSGRIGFDGTGVRGRLDPSLDFVAQTVSAGVTATLTVSGYASAPRIALSSSPQLPQDEILARLLFQQGVTSFRRCNWRAWPRRWHP